MRIIFRADASRVMGAGHVMRISVIAQEALSRGIACVFVGTISDLDWVQDYVKGIGFEQIIENFDSFEIHVKNDVLIVDSYTLDPKLEIIQRDHWAAVVSINDEMTPEFDADLRLIPGLRVPAIENEKSTLSGTDYILIRKSITKKVTTSDSSRVLKILIVGGGSDPFQFAPAVLAVLDEFQVNLEVHYFSDETVRSQTGKKFVRHSPGPELDQIANDFDLVLTTASTSSLEFIARELPTGVACAVDNQRDYYAQLGSEKYAYQFGERMDDGSWMLDSDALNKFLSDKGLRESLQKRIKGLIDLKGAARVVTAIENLLKVKNP